MAEPRYHWQDLLDLMHRLRSPGGCPWDAEQTHESLRPYLIEEAYEAVEAIEGGVSQSLCGELGDVLLQVVFHAELAAEEQDFTIEDVIERLCEKLVRRHPHVFGNVEAKDAAAVVENWKRIKAREKSDGGAGRSASASALDDVPRGMPALARAHRIGSKARSAGFDWDQAQGAREKILEELDEITLAEQSGDRRELEHEVGDMLLAASSYARLLGVSGETALRDAIERFDRRYRHVERELAARGMHTGEADRELLSDAWRRAKLREP